MLKYLSLLCIATTLLAVDTPPIDKTRLYLDKLREKTEIKEDSYDFPYLTVQTGKLFEWPANKTKERFERFFKQGSISITDKNAYKVSLPKEFLIGEQLDAIEECTVKKCNMKLHLVNEAKKVEEAEKKNKPKVYEQLVQDRFSSYLKSGELKGYEDRENNETAVTEMVKSLEFVKLKFPQAANFIFDLGWKKKEAVKSVLNTFYLNETVLIAPEKLQPIWRLGEVFEFNEGGNSLFFYLHVYTNHYFDASIALFEVIPLGEKSIVVVTDVLEVDELKKSGFIRAFFKGKMIDAVSLSQEALLKKIADLSF